MYPVLTAQMDTLQQTHLVAHQLIIINGLLVWEHQRASQGSLRIPIV